MVTSVIAAALVAQATEGGVASNPVSDAFYNLLPILVGVAAAVGVALRKRITEWAGEKQAARTEVATADVRSKQDAILAELAKAAEERADIKRRLPATAEERAEAARILSQGGPAGGAVAAEINLDED
jgi:hypothetical protein